jgi:hypothetical protein
MYETRHCKIQPPAPKCTWLAAYKDTLETEDRDRVFVLRLPKNRNKRKLACRYKQVRFEAEMSPGLWAGWAK